MGNRNRTISTTSCHTSKGAKLNEAHRKFRRVDNFFYFFYIKHLLTLFIFYYDWTTTALPRVEPRTRQFQGWYRTGRLQYTTTATTATLWIDMYFCARV